MWKVPALFDALTRSGSHPSSSDGRRYDVMCGDALTVLKTLPQGGIDMCMTSPPYWGHREYDTHGIGLENYYSDYIKNLCDILDQVKTVIKPEGPAIDIMPEN